MSKKRKRTNVFIPYPKDSVIVYQRESSKAYWEYRRSEAEANLLDSLPIYYVEEDVKSYLEQAAEYEREKELEFLELFYDGPEEGDITDKFNILFQSRERYEKISERIRDIIQNRSKQKNVTYGKKGGATHEYFTGMAPNLSALFGSYLQTELTHGLEGFRTRISLNSTFEEMKDQLDDVLENAILNASYRMAHDMEDSEIYGGRDEWQPIDEMLRSDPDTREIFMRMVKNSIGIKNFENLFNKMRGQKASGVKKQKTATIVREQLKDIGGRTAGIGGTVQENVIAIILNHMMKHSTGNIKPGTNAVAEAIIGNMAKTDTVMLFSTNASLDLNQIIRSLNQELSSNTGDIMDAYYQIQQFYNKWEKNMNELYTVYINSKNYQLGHDAHNYIDRQAGTFEELPEFFRRCGIDVSESRKFLDYVYNTMTGAMAEEDRGEVMETCTNALKAAASKLMFDDYQSYGIAEEGNTYNNSIHMYMLSGKYIPASVVFEEMAKAVGDNDMTNAEIVLPEEIHDEGPEWEDIAADASTNDEFKIKLWEYWLWEYEEAQRASIWQVSFSLRIKYLLNEH